MRSKKKNYDRERRRKKMKRNEERWDLEIFFEITDRLSFVFQDMREHNKKSSVSLSPALILLPTQSLFPSVRDVIQQITEYCWPLLVLLSSENFKATNVYIEREERGREERKN